MVVAPLELKSRFSIANTILPRLSLRQLACGLNHMVVAVPYTTKASAVGPSMENKDSFSFERRSFVLSPGCRDPNNGGCRLNSHEDTPSF